ncbi:hypothetical protein MHJ95_06830 [Corynebacterium imitans]|uniref:hypothetical protein n=1 Tax=Corynebacterium imitans TaxID=156978 RepID=UPI001EF204E6|nr:hypothetical protein [Corynebacterium imitans]MCG7278700.1 hypothetical protein [Corynebacterium imitans]
MKRLTACVAASAIALSAFATPAHAATVAQKDKDGTCAVSLTAGEKQFISTLFDESKAIGEHEQARDLVAAVESVYPGVIAENEKALKGEEADLTKVLPAQLAEKYASAQKTLKETEPTTERTLEDINTDSWHVGPDTKPLELPFAVAKSDAKLYDAWSTTPAGKVAIKQMQLSDADVAAAAACAKGTQANVEYPTAKPDLNVPAIIGGVVAALLALLGLLALPQLGLKLPKLPMLGK